MQTQKVIQRKPSIILEITIVILLGITSSYLIIKDIPQQNIMGDDGDGRLHAGLLEWQYETIFSKNPLKVLTLPFFFPEKYTLGLSDDNIWSIFPYAIVRAFGYPIGLSVQIEFATVAFLSFTFAYFFSRKFGLEITGALILSFLFAYGPQNRMYSSQIPRILNFVFPAIVYYVVLIRNKIIHSDSKSDFENLSILTGILFIITAIQFNLSFYYGLLSYLLIFLFILFYFNFFAKNEILVSSKFLKYFTVSLLLLVPSIFLKINSYKLTRLETNLHKLSPALLVGSILIILFLIYFSLRLVSKIYAKYPIPKWVNYILAIAFWGIPASIVKYYEPGTPGTIQKYFYAGFNIFGGNYEGTFLQSIIQMKLQPILEGSAGHPLTVITLFCLSLISIVFLNHKKAALFQTENETGVLTIFIVPGILIFLSATGIFTPFGDGLPGLSQIRNSARFVTISSFLLISGFLLIIPRIKYGKILLIPVLIFVWFESNGKSWGNSDPGNGKYNSRFQEAKSLLILPPNYLTLYQWTQVLEASKTGNWTPLVNGYSGYMPARTISILHFEENNQKIDPCLYLNELAKIKIQQIIIEKEFENRYSYLIKGSKDCKGFVVPQINVE